MAIDGHLRSGLIKIMIFSKNKKNGFFLLKSDFIDLIRFF